MTTYGTFDIDSVPAPSEFETDAARTEPCYTFDAFCTLHSIGWARERFWEYVVNNGHAPTGVEPLWKWAAWYADFDAADQYATQADALV